jgi:hypothetical protein
MGGSCSANGKRSDVYRVLVGKLEGKRPLGTLRCRWEDNIQKVGVWIGLGWLRIETGGGHL